MCALIQTTTEGALSSSRRVFGETGREFGMNPLRSRTSEDSRAYIAHW